MVGTLSHIRVLDLSRVLAGPWADLGAEVIKIERTGRCDDTRAWGPPYAKEVDDNNTSEAAYYPSTNRNNKSVTIDFTRPEGQQLVRDLAAQSDIVFENFKVGGLERYGLDYSSLRQVKPDLISCSIAGFGQTGFYAKRAGYDFLIQAIGGLMGLTGHPDGEDGVGPMHVGVALTDILAGLYAAKSALAVLTRRDQTGIGHQHIDLALLDVQVVCPANQSLNNLTTGQSPRWLGNAHSNIMPYPAFSTADGDMITAVGNDSQFASLCEAAEHPEWAQDPPFATSAAGVVQRGVLFPLLTASSGYGQAYQ